MEAEYSAVCKATHFGFLRDHLVIPRSSVIDFPTVFIMDICLLLPLHIMNRNRMESIFNTCNVLLTAEDIYDWEVIDLEGCHGPEGDILGGFVTSLVLLLGTTILCRK
jgi:hypothetical protein